MDSFDQSLKYLLQHEPADFVRFALRDPTVEVLGPVPSGLPSRGRDVDGAYYIAVAGERAVAHFEFHRRHQRAEELSVDVAEAQIRLHRREGLEVVSLVWDLYGEGAAEVVEERVHRFGRKVLGRASEAVYLRVSLRALGWRALLEAGPPALWPLVALAGGGAKEEAVRAARDAINARLDLSPGQHADHMAVLWFVAEAEDIPVRALKAFLTEEELMASTLWLSAFEKGEAKNRAETIIRVLMKRMGSLDPALRERIRAVQDLETLEVWQDEALGILDAQGAEKLAEKIRKATLS